VSHGDVEDQSVWRYSCAICGHAWTISKDGRQTVTHLTPLAVTRVTSIAS
jgi:hypothetical protein